MGPLTPYAIGERPGGYARLRQKPRGLFGEPAWNSLGEYHRTRGVDSKLPPGLPSDVTRIDHARPQDSALGGYEPLPSGRPKLAAASLGNVVGGILRLGRRAFQDPKSLQARALSTRRVLRLPQIDLRLTPQVDPDKIKSFLGPIGRRFWTGQGHNIRVPNTLRNRASTFYAGTPQEKLMQTALTRRAAGNSFGPNSALSAETAAVRGLTGNPTIKPYADYLGGSLPPGQAYPKNRPYAPTAQIVVPKLDYRKTEAGGLLGLLGLGGAGGWGATRLSRFLGNWADDGTPPPSTPAPAPAGAPAAPTAAPTASGGGGATPPAYGLGDVTADVVGHVGRHLPEYGIGAVALGGGALLVRHLQRRRAEEERRRLQEALLSKTGSVEDPFVAAARSCPTAAGILAYCGEAGYGEAEIRHTIIKAAGAVPGLAEEFERLFDGAVRAPKPAATRSRMKRAGEGYPGNTEESTPRPTAPAPRPPSPSVGARVLPPVNPSAPATPQARQAMQRSSAQVAALRARAPQPPSWGWGVAQAAGRALQGIPRMATGAVTAPATVGLSLLRLNQQYAVPGPGRPAQSAPASPWWAPMQASGRDMVAPIENAYQMPVEEIASRVAAPFTGTDEQAHQLARQSATPGITDEFQAGAQRSYRQGLNPDTSSWSRWWNNRAGDVSSVAPAALSFLGMAGPTGRLAGGAARGLAGLGGRVGGPTGDMLANLSGRLANAGPGMAQLGEGFILGGHQALPAVADPNLQGKGQEVAEQAAEEEHQVNDALAGRTPVKHIGSFAELADMRPEEAPMLFDRAQRGISNVQSEIEDKGGTWDPKKGYAALAGPLRDLIGAKMLAGQLTEDPKALYQRLASGDVSYEEMEQVGAMEGNEQIAGPPDAPPEAKTRNIMGFFQNPQVDSLTKTMVGLGVPLALVGLLSGVLGEGGLGGILLSVLGLGAAAYGAHRGGLLQGTAPGGIMDSVFGPAGPSNAGAAAPGTTAAGAAAATPAAGAPTAAPTAPAALPGDINADGTLSPEEGQALMADPTQRQALAKLPVERRAEVLGQQLPNMGWLQRRGLESAYGQFAGGDQQGATEWLATNGGFAPQEARAILEAYGHLKQTGGA
jgi:hypothetical protein